MKKLCQALFWFYGLISAWLCIYVSNYLINEITSAVLAIAAVPVGIIVSSIETKFLYEPGINRVLLPVLLVQAFFTGGYAMGWHEDFTIGETCEAYSSYRDFWLWDDGRYLKYALLWTGCFFILYAVTYLPVKKLEERRFKKAVEYMENVNRERMERQMQEEQRRREQIEREERYRYEAQEKIRQEYGQKRYQGQDSGTSSQVPADELAAAKALFMVGDTYTLEEIKKQRNRLLKSFHPDENADGNDDTAYAQKINQAFQLLKADLES